MYRIVVIDDESIVVKGIEKIIKREKLNGCIVGSANNGEEAMTVLQATKPDIVITDIRMPKNNGLELIKVMKTMFPETYFIVISGYREFDYIKKAMALGVKSYIEKPVTIDKVREALEKIEEEELKKKAMVMAENQGVRRSELDVYTHNMLGCILGSDSKGLKDNVRIYLTIVEAYFPEINHYRRECLQMLCMLSEFYAEKEKADGWTSGISFDAMDACETTETILAYTNTIIDHIIGHMETSAFTADNRHIKQILTYIGSHYNQEIGLNDLAEQVGLNASYLSLLFKDEVGISFIKYLTNIRMKKAKEYLLEGHKVAKVSQMVGYNSYRHFNELFKRYVGVCPSAYKGEPIAK